MLPIETHTFFEKSSRAPLLPPGLGVRESALEQVPSSSTQPSQGYTHEHHKFNRSLPAHIVIITI